MPGEEQELVGRAQRGDRDAFGRLALEHRDRVRGLLYRLVGAEGLDDLEQEIFVAAWLGLRKFRGEAAFGTWLSRIALNRAHRALKRRRPSPAPLPDALPDTGPEPLARMIDTEARDALAAAIGALPPKLRIAFTLRHVEGLSGVEVARLIGVREGTVRSRLHAARKALAGRLGSEVAR